MKASNRISIMTFVFDAHLKEGRVGLEELFAGLRKVGLEGVEVFQAELSQNAATVARYKKILANEGLALSCVDIIVDLAVRDAAARTKALDEVRAGIELAAEFRCDQVMIVGAMSKPELSARDARALVAEGLASQVEPARRAGVTLLTENFGMDPHIQCRGEDCREVLSLAGSPVRFTFDTGNFVFAGEDSRANLERFFPAIHHVHIKSWRRLADRQPGDSGVFADYIGCPVAEGVVPNRDLVRRLVTGGYGRWFSLECGAIGDNPLDAVKRDYTALKAWLAGQ